MWAVSLSLGEALDAFAGPTHVSTPQGPPQGGCIRGPLPADPRCCAEANRRLHGGRSGHSNAEESIA